jgi:hypothetical protein
MTDNKPSVHHAGELATWDTFAGLISCKVLEVHTKRMEFTIPEHTIAYVGTVKIQVTATGNHVYRQGEVITADARDVWPRNGWKHSRRGPSYVIVQPYIWE